MNVTDRSFLIEIATLAYPVSLLQTRQANPDKSYAENPSEELMAELGYALVYPTSQPDGDVVLEGPPVLTNGRWMQTWTVRDFNAQEIQARFLEKQANTIQACKSLIVQALERGCPYWFEDGTMGHIQLRDGDRANLSGLRLKAEKSKTLNDDKNFAFRVYEDVTKMPLTAQDIIDITDTAFDKFTEYMILYWAMKDQAYYATDATGLPVVPTNLDQFT